MTHIRLGFGPLKFRGCIIEKPTPDTVYGVSFCKYQISTLWLPLDSRNFIWGNPKSWNWNTFETMFVIRNSSTRKTLDPFLCNQLSSYLLRKKSLTCRVRASSTVHSFEPLKYQELKFNFCATKLKLLIENKCNAPNSRSKFQMLET